jgi:hypothetical protein
MNLTGNEAIHTLTRGKDQMLRIDLLSFDCNQTYAEYSTFYTEDEHNYYRLTTHNFSGTAGMFDGCQYSTLLQFTTTLDQENNDALLGFKYCRGQRVLNLILLETFPCLSIYKIMILTTLSCFFFIFMILFTFKQTPHFKCIVVLYFHSLFVLYVLQCTVPDKVDITQFYSAHHNPF